MMFNKTETSCILFITGILPMIYLEDIAVYVDRIDFDFYNAFDSIREGYCRLVGGMMFSME